MTRTSDSSESSAMPVIEVPRDEPPAPPAPPPPSIPASAAPAPLPMITTGPELPRRPYVDLFLISFLILFFELASIRWFGSTVVFLTFFTNIVLLACFLGMSVGLLTAGRRQNFIRSVLPLTFLTISVALITFNLYVHFWDKIAINVGGQTRSPQFIYFGTEYTPKDATKLKYIPLWAVAGVFFTLIALTFIGLGQAMGRAFDAIPNRVLAYTVDVIGSLTGIAIFAGMSYREFSPLVWFVPVIVILLYLVRRLTFLQVFAAVGTMFMVALGAYGAGQTDIQVFWSPYYKIAYTPSMGDVNTNNIAHQQMHKIEDTGSAYSLVHLLNRDSGGEPFADVMIIGAGSGNDVAAALRYGAKHVDAVEIDPTINWIGRSWHPDKPYGDWDNGIWHPNPRVSIHLDDGRSFARKTNNKYDLAIYALVDSLVLHSGYSSIRLENFLFTKQAFQDIKKTLKPDGVFAMYNYYRQGWVVARLNQMARDVFGTDPIIVSLSESPTAQTTVSPDDPQRGRITFLLVGNSKAALDRVRKSFDDKKSFWVNYRPSVNEKLSSGFASDVAAMPGSDTDWRQIKPAVVTTQPADPASLTPEQARAFDAVKHLPSDNWPQLYLQSPTIPTAPNLQGMAVVAVISILILLFFGGPVMFSRNSSYRAIPNGQMFFLGAGFMLLETKGVVHMALLFGSTWIVNSIVFFAILVMILCANLFVLALRPKNLIPYYALLILALLVNALVPMDYFLSMDVQKRTIASCAVVFVPVFFAGVIFASAFRRSTRPDIDFGSNVAGIILGGLSEQLSLMIGFNYLLLVAVGYYVLSYLLKPRTVEPNAELSTPPQTAVPAPA